MSIEVRKALTSIVKVYPSSPEAYVFPGSNSQHINRLKSKSTVLLSSSQYLVTVPVYSYAKYYLRAYVSSGVTLNLLKPNGSLLSQ